MRAIAARVRANIERNQRWPPVRVLLECKRGGLRRRPTNGHVSLLPQQPGHRGASPHRARIDRDAAAGDAGALVRAPVFAGHQIHCDDDCRWRRQVALHRRPDEVPGQHRRAAKDVTYVAVGSRRDDAGEAQPIARSNLPWLARLSSTRCASAALARGSTRSIATRRLPPAIARNRSCARPRISVASCM